MRKAKKWGWYNSLNRGCQSPTRNDAPPRKPLKGCRPMEKSPTIYLIDGTAYVYRAFHAIRNLRNSSGIPTNAVFGFTRMLIKLIQDRSPEYVAMFFDAKGPTFRHDMYPEYKANRPPMPEDLRVQIQSIKDITAGFNLSIIEKQGFEADDLIGTIARKAEQAGFSVVMVTGDKDFLQLVTQKTVIWDPMKDKIYNAETVRDEFGIEPVQIIDMMGLSGDTSDNVPGVPGIGPKTANQLITTFGTMGDLYDQIDAVTKKKQKENLVNFKDQAFLSRQLVSIKTDVPIDFVPEEFVYQPPDKSRLSELFGQFEFHQLQQEFTGKTEKAHKSYQALMDLTAVEDLAVKLATTGIFAVDTETTSENPMTARLVGISFSMMPNEAYYIPCCHEYIGAPQQPNLDDVLERLKPVLENPGIKKIGQNIKYDWMVFKRHGVELNGVVFDTMLASYLINPSKRSHGLDQIAMDYLGHKTTTYAEVVGKGKKACGFHQVPIENAVPYACEDADITLAVYQVLAAKLKAAGLMPLMETVEMPLVPVLMRMEMTGICVDRKRLQTLSKSFEQQLGDIEAEIYALAGETFNIRSSQQLGKILFEKIGLPVQKKTRKKTGYSTDMDVLTTLAEKHELPALVLQHRTLSKLKSTYSDALQELIHPKTDRIHTSFNQTVAATGRLSSSDPNLQNIPVRTEAGREIRRAFVPRAGWYLVSADYSQIELRILAHCSEDRILIDAFLREEDIHNRTAMEVFQVLPPMVDKELRRQAKAINFGIIYGMSPFGLSKALGISQKMAKTYIDNYFARYSGVKAFIDRTILEAGKTKKTSTLMGRIRLLPEIDSANKNIRQFAERMAVNTPIQGTAADLIKLAMIKVDRALTQKGMQTAMLLSVHDEIVFETPEAELESAKQLAADVMETVWDLRVPLKVNVAAGKHWAEI